MKQKTRLTISVALNLAFIVCFTLLAYTYRDKLYQAIVTSKGDPKIVMFGNSITAQGKWVELLGRTDVMTRALPGQCTYHFLNAMKPMVIDLHPEICFVMGGINDITVGVSLEKIREHYRLILENLVKNKITPVVTLTLYEQNDPVSMAEVKRLNEFLISYCKANNIDYLDINPLIADSTGLKPEYAVDKTHLNEKAYKVWAVEVGRILKEKGL
jgi:hypothetical protein